MHACMIFVIALAVPRDSSNKLLILLSPNYLVK